MSFHLGANTSNNVRAASTNAITACINTGSTNPAGQLLIYTGSQPSTPETTATGTLLVTVNFANPAFATSDSTGTAGLASGTAISATISTSGTAGWFRVVDRNGYDMFDGSIGVSGSGADMIFDSVAFVAGGTCTINSMSIQTPM